MPALSRPYPYSKHSLFSITLISMEEQQLAKTQELLAQDFAIEPGETEEVRFTEDQLLQLLAEQIADMIDGKMEVLLSLMYRLDISERKVHQALAPGAPEPPHLGLARLVLERQKQRAFTKLHYRPPKLDDEWTTW